MDDFKTYNGDHMEVSPGDKYERPYSEYTFSP